MTYRTFSDDFVPLPPIPKPWWMLQAAKCFPPSCERICRVAVDAPGDEDRACGLVMRATTPADLDLLVKAHERGVHGRE